MNIIFLNQNRIRWIKTILILAIFFITGILYSCNQMEKIQSLEVAQENIKEYSSLKSTEYIEETFPIKSIEESISGNHTESETANTEAIIYVFVCGYVNNPDVYAVSTKDRIKVAIEKAGGFCEGAAKEYMNLADFMQDGQKIYIPSLEELKEHINQDSTSSINSKMEDSNIVNSNIEEDMKVNLNLASKEELMTLSGVGEKRAEDIIRYRSQQGGFKSIEELKNVPGIKDKVFEKIKSNIEI